MCWQGYNKRIEAGDKNICTFRGEVCFFTDAVGLYTVRLPWSINVNQHGFSEREIYGLVSAEASEDWLHSRSISQDDATGRQSGTVGGLISAKKYNYERNMILNHWKWIFSAVCYWLQRAFAIKSFPTEAYWLSWENPEAMHLTHFNA